MRTRGFSPPPPAEVDSSAGSTRLFSSLRLSRLSRLLLFGSLRKRPLVLPARWLVTGRPPDSAGFVNGLVSTSPSKAAAPPGRRRVDANTPGSRQEKTGRGLAEEGLCFYVFQEQNPAVLPVLSLLGTFQIFPLFIANLYFCH